MKTTACLPLAACLLLPSTASETLATDYGRRARFDVLVEQTFSLATVEATMEVNGEERPRRGGDEPVVRTTSVAFTDAVVAFDGTAPRRVTRTFGELEGTVESTRRGESQETELESPFADVQLELSIGEEGGVVADVTEGGLELDGTEPLRLELPLDLLLPTEAVAEGDTWTVESEALLGALGLDLDPLLFPRAEPEPQPEGEGRRRRGGRGGDRGTALAPLLEGVEWEIELTFDGEEDGGVAVVLVDATGSGDPPAGDGEAEVSGSVDVNLEAQLRFSLEERRPLGLIVKGEVETQTDVRRSAGEREMRMQTARQGEFGIEITIGMEVEEDDED